MASATATKDLERRANSAEVNAPRFVMPSHSNGRSGWASVFPAGAALPIDAAPAYPCNPVGASTHYNNQRKVAGLAPNLSITSPQGALRAVRVLLGLAGPDKHFVPTGASHAPTATSQGGLGPRKES